MSKETGGPAFPEHIAVTEVGDTYSGETGMTLREYFAAKAMQGICAHENTWGCSIPEIANKSVALADALLLELEK